MQKNTKDVQQKIKYAIETIMAHHASAADNALSILNSYPK